MEMGSNVFLSYSSLELSFVILLQQRLESEGIKPFVSEWDVEAGANLWPDISSAIMASKIFLVLYTKPAVSSHWVNQEVGFAEGNGKIIIPVAEDTNDLDGLLKGKKCIRFNRRKPYETIDAIVERCKAEVEK